MYNDYEGSIDFTLVIKGAIALVVIWVVIVVVGNFLSDVIWRIKNKK